MDTHYQVVPDVEAILSHFPIPKMGVLPVNAFVIKAEEPVLVDTGMGIESEEFIKTLQSIIDPQDLKWIWLTHDDADHTGSIKKVLEIAPNARLVAHALAALRMSTAWQVPMHRVYWLNPDESIQVGDRKLTAIKPPLFDNPTTIGFYDDKSQTFFSADFFGAILPEPVQNAGEISEENLVQGMIGWATADSPWVHNVLPGEFQKALEKIRRIAPKLVCSAHLPPAQGKTEQFLKVLAEVPASAPFIAPNQTMLEQILAETGTGC
jgi:flavorubredoxin